MTMKPSNAAFRLSLGAAAVAGALCVTAPTPAQACSPTSDVYIGTVCQVAFTFCPKGYEEANGQTMEISQNNALFALIGTTYGGDGRVSFRLPDFRGRTMAHVGTGIALTPTYLGEIRGREEVTQVIDQMAHHGHNATFVQEPGTGTEVKVSTQQGSKDTPAAGDYLGTVYDSGTFSKMPQWVPSGSAAPTVKMGGVTAGTPGAASVTVFSTGGAQPMDILNPQLVVRFCIATEGVFPPRS